MEDNEKIKVRVKIAGTDYKLTIPRQDEEKYRRAAIIVNSTITSYKAKYKATYENYFAMAALHASAENVEWLMRGEVENKTVAELSKLEKMLDEYIAKIKK